MGDNGRDPRRDPRAGDVLRGRKEWVKPRRVERRVEFVSEGDPPIVYFVSHGGMQDCENNASLRSWRRWAAGAEVIRVADDVPLARLLPVSLP